MQTLIIVSHPNLLSSVANRTILEQLKKSNHSVVFRHLDSLYHDFTIDVAGKQAALLLADNIVFQFPFY